MDLIADIGATNARCALLDEDGQTVTTRRFSNRDFDGLASLLTAFTEAAPLDRAALAIAAPLAGDEIAMTNIDWRFSRADLKSALNVDELLVVNDFEAVALALPILGPGDCTTIGPALPQAPHATRAVLGPGSGLGVASAVPHENGWTAVSGEGGHVTLPAMNETEARIIADYADTNGHCSAESLLSGLGLVRIYASLARESGLAEETLSPADVTKRLTAGDPTAARTYEVFFAMLGTVAGNLALTVGARGGVYVAGGIVPRVVDSLEQSEFRERFVAKGRYRGYLESIPTAVITMAEPAFAGLRTLLALR